MLAEILPKIAGMEFEGEAEKPFYPRPSLTGPEKCIRQLVYWAQGEDKRALPGRAVMVFDDSSWHEELTADWLRKSAFQVHSEQMPIIIDGAFPWMPEGTWKCKVCNDDIPFKSCHGHIDWISTDLTGKDFLVEHKALSHFGFEALMKGSLPLDYLTQMATYMRGLCEDNPELSEGVLLVKNKNQSAYLEFLVKYNIEDDALIVVNRLHHGGDIEELNIVMPSITDNAFYKFAEVDKHRKADTLPARQYERDHWRCEYCPYTRGCWSTWVDEHETLATEVELEAEVADLLRYERETAAHEGEMRKEKEVLRKKIKEILTKANVRQGKAGEYTVDWKIGIRKAFNKDLLPTGMYQSALEEVPQERLIIKKIKTKEVQG